VKNRWFGCGLGRKVGFRDHREGAGGAEVAEFECHLPGSLVLRTWCGQQVHLHGFPRIEQFQLVDGACVEDEDPYRLADFVLAGHDLAGPDKAGCGARRRGELAVLARERAEPRIGHLLDIAEDQLGGGRRCAACGHGCGEAEFVRLAGRAAQAED
jgi:hypothetical protein